MKTDRPCRDERGITDLGGVEGASEVLKPVLKILTSFSITTKGGTAFYIPLKIFYQLFNNNKR